MGKNLASKPSRFAPEFVNPLAGLGEAPLGVWDEMPVAVAVVVDGTTVTGRIAGLSSVSVAIAFARRPMTSCVSAEIAATRPMSSFSLAGATPEEGDGIASQGRLGSAC